MKINPLGCFAVGVKPDLHLITRLEVLEIIFSQHDYSPPVRQHFSSLKQRVRLVSLDTPGFPLLETNET
jgi:hypothetical protein